MNVFNLKKKKKNIIERHVFLLDNFDFFFLDYKEDIQHIIFGYCNPLVGITT